MLHSLKQDHSARIETKTKRLKARWDHAYLLRLLAQSDAITLADFSADVQKSLSTFRFAEQLALRETVCDAPDIYRPDTVFDAKLASIASFAAQS